MIMERVKWRMRAEEMKMMRIERGGDVSNT